VDSSGCSRLWSVEQSPRQKPANGIRLRDYFFFTADHRFFCAPWSIAENKPPALLYMVTVSSGRHPVNAGNSEPLEVPIHAANARLPHRTRSADAFWPWNGLTESDPPRPIRTAPYRVYGSILALHDVASACARSGVQRTRGPVNSPSQDGSTASGCFAITPAAPGWRVRVRPALLPVFSVAAASQTWLRTPSG